MVTGVEVVCMVGRPLRHVLKGGAYVVGSKSSSSSVSIRTISVCGLNIGFSVVVVDEEVVVDGVVGASVVVVVEVAGVVLVVKYCTLGRRSYKGFVDSSIKGSCLALKVKPLLLLCKLYSNGLASVDVFNVPGYLRVVVELAPFKISSSVSYLVSGAIKLCGATSDITNFLICVLTSFENDFGFWFSLKSLLLSPP